MRLVDKFIGFSIISFMCIFLISLSFTAGLFVSYNSQLNITDNFHIKLDCEHTDGLINHFSEINCGPLPNPNVEGINLANQFKKTGFNFVRTHDFNGPTDVSSIFPNMAKDPTIATNYNFSLSDRYISEIIDADCQVFYRLGESATTTESLRRPPDNISKWAEICKHIIMHYNEGWADGFYYNISYWEIWNEPDLDGFWNGTTEQYYELYKVTATTLKQHNPELKIGGPCTSSIYNLNFTSEFLSFIKNEQIPLDFFSWHMYADTPFQLYNGSKLIRNLLDTHGFYDTENINTEWNYNILSPQRDKDNAKNAAFTACVLSTFQDAGIDYAFRYRATQDNNPLVRFIGFDLSLFTNNGLFKIPALTYLAFQYLSVDTPIRLKNPVVNTTNKVTSLAGISKDDTNISVLISNFHAPETNYKLIIDHIPWKSNYTVAHYVIDKNHHLQQIDKFWQKEAVLYLNNSIHPSTVHFFRLTNTSLLPDEGPIPAKIPFFLQIPIFDNFSKILAILLMLIFFS